MTWPVFTEQATLVGHRGLGKGDVGGYLENTVESFVATIDAGLRWVEVDVQLAADGTLVVAHDPVLSDGTHVADLADRGTTEHGVLRLETLLEALPAEAGLVFDVKSSIRDAARAANATTASVLAQSWQGELGRRPVLALSFDPAALRQLREAAPGMALGLLTWKRFPIEHAVAAAAHMDVQVLAVHTGSVWTSNSPRHRSMPAVEDVVDSVHAAGRQLLVWCPSERPARALAAAGVDALVVDDVPRHLRLLTKQRRLGSPAPHRVVRR
jgi:glycerophosphoryl diester phosphodiesterase